MVPKIPRSKLYQERYGLHKLNVSFLGGVTWCYATKSRSQAQRSASPCLGLGHREVYSQSWPFSFFSFCIAETLNINNFQFSHRIATFYQLLESSFRLDIYMIHDYLDWSYIEGDMTFQTLLLCLPAEKKSFPHLNPIPGVGECFPLPRALVWKDLFLRQGLRLGGGLPHDWFCHFLLL